MLAEIPRVLRVTDVVVLLAALVGSVAAAQTPGASPVQLAQATTKVDSAKRRDASAFFESQDPIEVTLTTNIGKIRGDKKENAPWRPAALSYKAPDGNLVTVPIKARTRGIWRLKMCDFPPLRLNFSGETSKGTIFDNLDKPKLVGYCQNADNYEQYILQEYQLYRIYQLITPVSHKTRLIRLTYADSADGKVRARRYGFIMEEPKALAARLGGKVLEEKGAGGENLDPLQDAVFGLFQYFIGNTDFSVAGLHNVELFLNQQGDVMPIAYDFDFSGAVNARYATADSSLRIRSVRERVFRGYCTDPESFTKAFAIFNEQKPKIYALYSDSIGKLMDKGRVKETLGYFDEFYEIINNRGAAKRSILESCLRPR